MSKFSKLAAQQKSIDKAERNIKEAGWAESNESVQGRDNNVSRAFKLLGINAAAKFRE
jgi:hypothetical protein